MQILNKKSSVLNLHSDQKAAEVPGFSGYK